MTVAAGAGYRCDKNTACDPRHRNAAADRPQITWSLAPERRRSALHPRSPALLTVWGAQALHVFGVGRAGGNARHMGDDRRLAILS